MELAEKLTKDISKKYSKVWDAFNKYIFNLKLDFVLLIVENKIYIRFSNIDRRNIPFSMIYGLLEDFFNNIGIDININQHIDSDYDCYNYVCGYGYKIICNKTSKVFYQSQWDINNNTKNEAKYQAILKACEILNNKEIKNA